MTSFVMKRRASLVVSSSCIFIAALCVADAFVPPAVGLRNARNSAVSACRRGTSGARADRTGRSPLARREGRQQQHQDALKAQMTDEEMALDQALIRRVAQEVEAESGVDLDQLINPAKVVNLERDLVKLRAALENGPGSERSTIEQEIEKKEATLAKEKRMVMQGWLKNIFVGQAVVTTVLGGMMAYDQVPFFPHVDLAIQVLGFWFVWLFTVPSLRARKPGASEKVALDIAFLATPVVSFAMPFITKDPVPIYWVNIATVAACYGYGFTVGKPDGGVEGAAAGKSQPKWLKFILKSLDFGSGQERGVRGAARDRMLNEVNQEQAEDKET